MLSSVRMNVRNLPYDTVPGASDCQLSLGQSSQSRGAKPHALVVTQSARVKATHKIEKLHGRRVPCGPSVP